MIELHRRRASLLVLTLGCRGNTAARSADCQGNLVRMGNRRNIKPSLSLTPILLGFAVHTIFPIANSMRLS